MTKVLSLLPILSTKLHVILLDFFCHFDIFFFFDMSFHLSFIHKPRGEQGDDLEICPNHVTQSQATTTAWLNNIKPEVVLSFSDVLCKTTKLTYFFMYMYFS